MMRKAAICILLLLFLTGCGGMEPEEPRASVQVIAMDTPMLLTAYGESAETAVRAAEDVIRELDSQLSRTNPDSDVSRLNAAGGQLTPVGDALRTLLRLGVEYNQSTDGAFDINLAPLLSAWGFSTDSFRIPPQSELDALLERPRLTFTDSGDSVQLPEGAAVDLGGIAKGYAADRIAEIFQENGVARGTAQLGGNVLAWGTRPDGNPWRIGIQDPARPDDSDGFAGVLELSDAFAVTSGDYQRYFEQDGKRYHHILDPATGYPAESGLRSVTVIASCKEAGTPGTMCDAFSTALFVMGEEKALAFREKWNAVESNVPIDLVLITSEGRLIVTGGLDVMLDGEGGYELENVA